MMLAYSPAIGGIEWRGLQLQQNAFAPATWAGAISRVRPARIIEIGTGSGGMTCALGMAALQCHAQVFTFDVGTAHVYPALFAALHIVHLPVDCFNHSRTIEQLIRPAGTVILLCDGGNKIREFTTFARFLKPGDVIAAHDYVCHGGEAFWGWSEISVSDVSEAVASHDLKPFMQDDFDKAAWLVYRRQA